MKFYTFTISENRFITFVIYCTSLGIEVLASYTDENFLGNDVKGMLGLPDDKNGIPQTMMKEKLLEKYAKSVKEI